MPRDIDFTIARLFRYGDYLIVKNGSMKFPLFPKAELIYQIKNNLNDRELFLDYLSKYLKNNSIQTNALFNKLNSLAFKNNSVICVKHEIIQDCNLRCKYCYVKNIDEKFLPINEITKIIDKVSEYGTYEYFITGGEPLLHPSFKDIIQYCHEKGLNTIVQTNGYLLNAGIIGYLEGFPFLEIFISHHGNNSNKFNEFTGNNNAFEIINKNIFLLSKSKVNYKVKINTSILTVEELNDTINNFKLNNIKFDVMHQPLPIIAGDDNDEGAKFINYDMCKYLINNNIINLRELTCKPSEIKYWISSSGDVFPCELLREKIGNLTQENVKDILCSNSSNDYRRSLKSLEPQKCLECLDRAKCQRCIAYNLYSEKMMNYFCERTKIFLSTGGKPV